MDELNRLLGIVVDVENLFMCVHKEEDADTKQARRIFFYFWGSNSRSKTILNSSKESIVVLPKNEGVNLPRNLRGRIS